MCAKVFTALALIATLLASGLVIAGSTNNADAKDYYTRKRVNGVWVTGRFERKRSVRTDKDPTSLSVTPSDSLPLPSPSSGLATAEDRPPQFQLAAIEARRAAISAGFGHALPQDPGLLPLRRALEERAKIMSTAAAGAVHVRAIRSLTLDFESRVRIIQFADGSRTEEPFDPAATGAVSAGAIP
jgi:hypothetical protein